MGWGGGGVGGGEAHLHIQAPQHEITTTPLVGTPCKIVNHAFDAEGISLKQLTDTRIKRAAIRN